MARDFKTIVFFGEGFPQYSFIKDEFSQYNNVRVFQSSIADEISQILTQSIVTAILINHTKYATQLVSGDLLSMKKAGVRFYFLNNDPKFSRAEIEKLSLMKVTTLTGLSDYDLRAKLEMFILNKLRIASGPKDPSEDGDSSKQSYFTHLKKVQGQWVIYVSTHEQEREIETIFDRSWTIFCMDLLDQADNISEIIEDSEFSKDYLSIVYPHHHSDQTKAVSVMHVKKDASFADTYQRALTFLAKI